VRYDKANQAILARQESMSSNQTTVGMNFIIVY
jgi:hypothetical protein